MPRSLKIILWLMFTLGFISGFAGLVFPNQSPLVESLPPDTYQSQRLHVFLFNLVGGGTTLLYFTEQKSKVSWRCSLYLLGSITFSLAAFFNQYLLAIILAVGLAVLVEFVRVRRYSFFPYDFFRNNILVAHKFHQAALLCLSLGLLIASFVMLNNHYLHIFYWPSLVLDDFFLGFSFPISLMTFSVIFSIGRKDDEKHIRVLREVSFWVNNLGEIIFFIFIILQIDALQVAVAMLLFIDVLIVFFLFRYDSRKIEQENFLISGILFLVITSITGIMITLAETYMPVQEPRAWALLLKIHTYLALYGWNLSGLTVIIRYNEFPLKLHDLEIILTHWLVVAWLAPMGSLYTVFAVVALPGFGVLIWLILFSGTHHDKHPGSDTLIDSLTPRF